MLRHGNGNLFLEQNSLTWFFYDHSVIDRLHGHIKTNNIPDSVKAHAVKVRFEDANENPFLYPSKKTSFYSNYFLGNDESKWASNVSSYEEMSYQNIYDGIDIKFYESGEQLKYDFIVEKGADPSQIRMNYEGADEVRMSGENLLIKTSVTDIIEEKPYAYQIINGTKKEVKCRFHIDQDKKVSFHFPEKYDENYELVIDPILLFSTYTGSSADNFGFTATYDDDKNTYVGGIVFSGGSYPTTAGAFQISWAGGNGVDIGISKYNVDGTNMIYSTYIGGSSYEAPHSLVTNSNGELFILGTTSSTNFPTVIGCFDNTFNGGPVVTPPSSGMSYPNGSDVIIVHLNAAGSALIGSTYMGGNGTDGLNLAFNLAYNYGDAFRGEIIVDAAGNCLVSTTTDSPNFPTSTNAPFSSALGGSDAVVFKLNPTLTTLTWSTYFGGNSNDSGYGIQIDSNQEIYVSGGTESNNLPVTLGAIKNSYGGAVDGYIVRFSTDGGSILACTYIGTASYDQTYFVQLDTNDDVYVVGQTTGNYPITAGVYNNPNSGQFIQKVNKDFNVSLMSTRLGRGAGTVDFSPSAFLVNVCGHIYLSGWGGPLNGLYLAQFSTTANLPVTPDAFQSNTDGSDFYLIVLDVDASDLLYASFFGGAISREHVDGGTSRFDKDGTVYQAVCAGCGSNDDFPTTPGVWSNTNNSNNCNLGTFKFDLAPVIAETHFAADTYCSTTVEIIFDNISAGAINSYFWDFGDGVTSTEENPTHVFNSVGSYLVMLVAQDSNICNGVDTTFFSVVIPPLPTLSVMSDVIICEGDSLPLLIDATGGNLVYSWTPDDFLISGSVEDPIAFPIDDTEYIITIIDTNGCNLTDTIIIDVNPKPVALYEAQIIPCILPFNLDITNNSEDVFTYFWDFGDGTTSTSPDPQYIYDSPGNYILTLIVYDSSFCAFTDTMTTLIFIPPLPSLNVMSSTTICEGDSIVLDIDANGMGISYQWTPNSSLSSGAIEDPFAFPNTSTEYGITITDTNGCSLTDTIMINVNPIPLASFNTEFTLCTLPFTLDITNSSEDVFTYLWDFGDGNTSSSPEPQHIYDVPGIYILSLIVYDSSFCAFSDTMTTEILVPPLPSLSVMPPTTICEGDSILLDIDATGAGLSYEWTPSSTLSSGSTEEPVASPITNTDYEITITDTNGCELSATIPITVNEEVTAYFEMETTPCLLPFTLTTSNGSDNSFYYFWDFGDGNTSALPDPQHVYTVPGNYLITMIAYDSSFCAFSDTAISVVNVFAPLEITVSEGDSVCIGSVVELDVDGGETFQWFPSTAVNDPDAQNTFAIVDVSTNFMVIAEDSNGCVDTGYVEMIIFPPANIDAGPDQIYGFGTGMELNPNLPDSSNFYWTPPTGLSCTDCLNPLASPDVTTMYYLFYTDEFGCTFMDSVLVQVSPTLYVPNAFTPNGDDKNNVFKPIMTNLEFYELFIFDRWGQLILQTTDTEAYWDGTFKGIKCPIDVYVWKINYSSELEPNVIKEIYGHVTLIR